MNIFNIKITRNKIYNEYICSSNLIKEKLLIKYFFCINGDTYWSFYPPKSYNKQKAFILYYGKFSSFKETFLCMSQWLLLHKKYIKRKKLCVN